MLRPIFLIGFMCSGKTTLGRALARRLQVPFTDLDAEIERCESMSIGDIFRSRGEETFRRIEEQTLTRVLAGASGGVIALGGGTPCRAGAMARLDKAGITVWLEPSPERLTARLMNGRATRPLLQGINSEAEMSEFVISKMEERRPYYELAQYCFDSSRLETEEEISDTVEQFVASIIDPASNS